MSWAKSLTLKNDCGGDRMLNYSFNLRVQGSKINENKVREINKRQESKFSSDQVKDGKPHFIRKSLANKH